MAINWLIVGCGCAGGALAEFLKWFNLRESPNLPAYAKSPFYWIMTIIMIGVGGLLTILYNLGPEKIVLALNIGASAPLIIKALASAAPQPPGGGTPEPTEERFVGMTKDAPRAPSPRKDRSGASLVNFLAGR